MSTSWKSQQSLAEDACPHCQGSAYVPAPSDRVPLVMQCSECEGTGKDAAKKAA